MQYKYFGTIWIIWRNNKWNLKEKNIYTFTVQWMFFKVKIVAGNFGKKRTFHTIKPLIAIDTENENRP